MFYNRSMKSWLEKNSIEMYSLQNEGRSAVTERFITTLKNEMYNYMTSYQRIFISYSIFGAKVRLAW